MSTQLKPRSGYHTVRRASALTEQVARQRPVPRTDETTMLRPSQTKAGQDRLRVTADRPVTQPSAAREQVPFLPGEDQGLSPSAIPRSALKYVNPSGDQVYQQGNKRLIVTYGKPPVKHQRHWLMYMGVGMLTMGAIIAGFNSLGTWWNNHQLDNQYGNPRTWQTDQAVGHSDSALHPSHFMFMDLNAHVVIVEMPGGDVTHAKLYAGPPILGDNSTNVPVTGEFRDIHHDGKPEMLVHLGNQTIVYLNNGKQFIPAS